ncbi:sugar transferase [Saltatorellus ferox]|uniref:sugar transferase n=1 Tax=Saltatorellus ferox TaxID=2528018 RepID=UPI003AF393DE
MEPSRPARFAPLREPHDTRDTRPVATPYVRWVRPALGAALVAAISLPVAATVAGLTLVQLAAYRRWGEVFFLQTRAGQHGKPFRIVKFRTMQPDESGVARPTRLGALLRKSHLDELPQLWNVLAGDMSLIGPRPETLDLEEWGEKEVPGFQSRLVLRPGITGLAQVVQDSTPQVAELYREKLRLNQLYQTSISLRTDAWILFRTAVRPVRPRAFDHSSLKPR